MLARGAGFEPAWWVGSTCGCLARQCSDRGGSRPPPCRSGPAPHRTPARIRTRISRLKASGACRLHYGSICAGPESNRLPPVCRTGIPPLDHRRIPDGPAPSRTGTSPEGTGSRPVAFSLPPQGQDDCRRAESNRQSPSVRISRSWSAVFGSAAFPLGHSGACAGRAILLYRGRPGPGGQ